MAIPLEHRIAAFIRAGEKLRSLSAALRQNGNHPVGKLTGEFSGASLDFLHAIREASRQNPWFTHADILRAMEAIAAMLDPGSLKQWLQAYPLDADGPKNSRTVLVIMAGNIPLVGFHDLMCVLISGHKALIKTASGDSRLPVAMGGLIVETEPRFGQYIRFPDGKAGNHDAVIATGSNNSARYFDYYFGRVPHIIRKNRNSMAVIRKEESPEDLRLLGDDVFAYYGLGCRNVSQVWIPAGFDMHRLKTAWEPYATVMANRKYFHNFSHQKALFLVNREPHTDLGFCLLRESPALSSPLSVVHLQVYHSPEEAFRFAGLHSGELQCLVSTQVPHELESMAVKPGSTQHPGPWDYADRVDTIQFLTGIS
jgi:hypothetical protein